MKKRRATPGRPLVSLFPNDTMHHPIPVLLSTATTIRTKITHFNTGIRRSQRLMPQGFTTRRAIRTSRCARAGGAHHVPETRRGEKCRQTSCDQIS